MKTYRVLPTVLAVCLEVIEGVYIYIGKRKRFA